jgi:hypothetical protein
MTAHANSGATEGDAARAWLDVCQKPDGDPEAADQREVIDRLIVALIPQARVGLRRLQDSTSMSKTDITNRAIVLYEFIEAQLGSGQELLIRDGSTGEIQRVLLA